MDAVSNVGAVFSREGDREQPGLGFVSRGARTRGWRRDFSEAPDLQSAVREACQMNQRKRDSAGETQGKKGALDMLNAATLQKHLMIPQEAAAKGQETEELESGQSEMEETGVVLDDGSQREESDGGHQQIRLSKFPAVLLPRRFIPINGTFGNFVGPVHAAGLRLDLQGTESNTQTRRAMAFDHAAGTRENGSRGHAKNATGVIV
jgi:hypothetical protein